jgi:hypothetical protein
MQVSENKLLFSICGITLKISINPVTSNITKICVKFSQIMVFTISFHALHTSLVDVNNSAIIHSIMFNFSFWVEQYYLLNMC